MSFTEITFLFIFLPVSIILYLLSDEFFHRDKVNNALLVFLSLLFYFWSDKKSLLIFMEIVIFAYMAGNMAEGKKRKKAVFPIVCLVGTLVFYKYASFITTWINSLTNKEVINLDNLVVPIGISFVVFESVSYVVDIYRGDAAPGTLLECFTFLSLFPKLVSGPIVLWKDFKPQLKGRGVTIDGVSCGIDRIIIGYAKKVIIADTFGIQIALINNRIADSGVDIPTMWLRALLYFFQLYFDFSGYSDIAIGLCSIFGFAVKENFRYPYLSTSISEFWRRWHISLGIWFREYVYIPLGGNRRGNVYVHLIIVFLLTGIWHGSGLPFLIWGGVNALFVVLERAVSEKGWYKKLPAIVKWFFTVVIIYFSWIIFMSNNMGDVGKNYVGFFMPMTTDIVNFTWQYYLSERTLMLIAIAVAGNLTGLEKINVRINTILATGVGSMVKRILLLFLFVVDILFIVNSTYSPFIYFQF